MVSTHTGPLCQSSAGMATSQALSVDLVTAGFQRPLVGKVAISSFMGEWGYLLCTKQAVLMAPDWRLEEQEEQQEDDEEEEKEVVVVAGIEAQAEAQVAEKEKAAEVVRVRPGVWASHLPQDVHVLDADALRSFFLIPRYYYKGC